jgi:hypothetical protein
VLVFGSLFLGERNASAQTTLELTQAELQNIIDVEWLPAAEITSGSFAKYALIKITDQGTFTGNLAANRFENNYLIITKPSATYHVFLTEALVQVSSGAQISAETEIGFTAPTGQPDTVRRIGVIFGGLGAQTQYQANLKAVPKTLTTVPAPGGGSSAQWLPINGSPWQLSTDPEKVTTLPSGQGDMPVSETQDVEGATGFDRLFTDDTVDCGFIGDSNIVDCFISALYHIFYNISAFLLAMAGKLFDILTSLAISSKVYRDSTFVITGWSIVRDISNVFFIFVLLIAAFRLMFGQNVGSTIKNVIVVALLINFSLFMVRVVVDSTNILAHLFYNRISQVGELNNNTAIQHSAGSQYGISEGIAAGLNLQNFLAGPQVEQFLKEVGRKKGILATIIFLAFLVNMIAAWMFFKVGWMMLGRIIGLWITMILAPLAFVLKLIPGAATYIEGLSFQKWMGDGIKYALLAPVFLFFVYLIILFINSNFIGGFLNSSNYEGYERVIVLSLSFMVIIGILKIATDTAEKMSGEAGKAISGAATKAFGMAAGVAGGAVMATGGLALRQTAGRAGALLAKSETLKDWETSDSWIAQQAGKRFRNVGKAAESGSWDARSGMLGKGLSAGLNKLGVEGVNFDNAVVGAVGGSVKDGEGGFKKAREDASKERIERAKELKVGPDSDLSVAAYKAREHQIRSGQEVERLEAEHGAGSNHQDLVAARENLEEATAIKKFHEDNLSRANKARTLNYADVVEGEWGMRYGKTGASETADKIRKGEVSEAEKIAAALKKMRGGGQNPQQPNPVVGFGRGNNPPPNQGGPNASTQNQPQAGTPQATPGNMQNVNRVVAATAPGAPVAINSGQGERNVVGGFGQGLQEIQEAKKQAARTEAREGLRKGRNPGQYVSQEATERYARRFGNEAANKRFNQTVSSESYEYAPQTRRGEKTEIVEAPTQEKPTQATAQPGVVKLDTEGVKEALGGVEAGLGNIEQSLGNVGENLGTVGKGLGSMAENLGAGLQATAKASTEAGEKMTKAVDAASEKERFRDMKGGTKQSADFKKMAEEIKGLKNSLDKKENSSRDSGQPPIDNAA